LIFYFDFFYHIASASGFATNHDQSINQSDDTTKTTDSGRMNDINQKQYAGHAGPCTLT
jgi:hypothetical protein